MADDEWDWVKAEVSRMRREEGDERRFGALFREAINALAENREILRDLPATTAAPPSSPP